MFGGFVVQHTGQHNQVVAAIEQLVGFAIKASRGPRQNGGLEISWNVVLHTSELIRLGRGEVISQVFLFLRQNMDGVLTAYRELIQVG